MSNTMLPFPFLRDPPYEQFLEEHLLPNKPCLLELSLEWPAFKDWINADGLPAWAGLAQLYADCNVSVVDSPSMDCRTASLHESLASLANGSCLYIKDWHLAQTAPLPFYDTPLLFQDDWMNAFYCAEAQDDFRFVYAGAKGTYTPRRPSASSRSSAEWGVVHRDVYCSYSWSTNGRLLEEQVPD
jgi:hypothetical protein